MHRFALVLVAIASLTSALEAKGPTVKLTLTGPGLARAVEITDPELLQRSHVWAGSFIGTTMSAPPRVRAPLYTVDTQDGHWHRPPTAWAAALAKYLP